MILSKSRLVFVFITIAINCTVTWLFLYFDFLYARYNAGYLETFGRNETQSYHVPFVLDHNDTFRESDKENYLKTLLERYQKKHDEEMSGEPKRVVFCHVGNGLGNRMHVFVGCFVYALFTDRILNLNPPLTALYPGMQHPFRLDPVGKWKGDTSKYPSITTYNNDEQRMLCDDLNETMKDEPAVRMTGIMFWDNFVSSIQYNSHWRILETWPTTWYSILSKFLVRADAERQRRVEDYAKQFFGGYNIAIHLREQIQQVDANYGRYTLPDEVLYIQTAETLSYQARNAINSSMEIVWFIATENTTWARSIQQRFASRNTRVVYLDLSQQDMRGHKADGTSYDGLVTWFLISLCNDVITADSSTFASTAAAHGGYIHVACNQGGFCYRKITPLPVQLYPVPPHKFVCSSGESKYCSVDSAIGAWEKYGAKYKEPSKRGLDKRKVIESTQTQET